MSLEAKIGLNTSAFKTGLASVENEVKGFGGKVTGILAGAFTLDAVIGGLSQAIAKGDALQDIAEKFNISASKLQTLGNAAMIYGSSLEGISTGLNKLSLSQQKAIAGDKNLQESFAEVGVSASDLKSLSVDEVFLRIADSFAKGNNAGRQFILINELLGKASTDLVKVLNQGSDAIVAQGQAVGVSTDEEIAKLSELSDAIKILQNKLEIAFGNIAAFGGGVIQMFQNMIQFATMAGAASSAAFSGDFAGAREIMNSARMIEADQIKERNSKKKSQVSFNAGDEDAASKGMSDRAKAAAKELNELEKIRAQIIAEEDKNAQALMDTEEKLIQANGKINMLKELQKSTFASETEQAKLLVELAKAQGDANQLNLQLAKEKQGVVEKEAAAAVRLSEIGNKIKDIEAERAGTTGDLLQQRAKQAISELQADPNNRNLRLNALESRKAVEDFERSKATGAIGISDQEANQRALNMGAAMGTIPAETMKAGATIGKEAGNPVQNDTVLKLEAMVMESLKQLDQTIKRTSGSFGE